VKDYFTFDLRFAKADPAILFVLGLVLLLVRALDAAVAIFRDVRTEFFFAMLGSLQKV
jgi:hypothetical protein